MSKPKHMRLSKKSTAALTVIAVALMVGGALVIAYPRVFGWMNHRHQSRDHQTYEQTIKEMSSEAREEQLSLAHDYNEDRHFVSVDAAPDDESRQHYNGLLDPTNNGMMGYVDIDAINVHVPLYHGISDEVMLLGAGHMEQTSLPVGGPSTHAAISAHRGEPGASYFKDLDQLVIGDTFSVTVYDQKLTYEVDQILIVEPDDQTALAIEDGADLFTLVTCTPYGVNSHRLLVRGRRVS